MPRRLAVIALSVLAGYGVAAVLLTVYRKQTTHVAEVVESPVARLVAAADARHVQIETDGGYRVVTKAYRCREGDGEVIVKGKDKEIRQLSWRELRIADGCVTSREYFRWARRMVYFSLSRDCTSAESGGQEHEQTEERVWFHEGRPIRRVVKSATMSETTGSEAEAAIAADYAKAMRIAETGTCEGD